MTGVSRPGLRSGPVRLRHDEVDWCTGRRELDRLRILVLGAGVIGSVYAGKLLQAGHDVVLLARGPRLVDLQTHGLILEDARVRGPFGVAGALGQRARARRSL